MPSNESRIEAIARRLRDEGGQVLPFTALLMVVLVGFAGMVIDVGRVYIAQRQLQNAVDATAIAVAANMPDDYAGWCQAAGADASNCAFALANRTPPKPEPPPLGYGGAGTVADGAPNALFGYEVTADPATVTFVCSPDAPQYDPTTQKCPADASLEDQPPPAGTGQGTPCQPPGALAPEPAADVGCNAVKISESATVKSTFAAIFHFAQFNVTASATASAPESKTPTPLNVEVVLDTTPSMKNSVFGGHCTSPVTGIPQKDTGKIDCAKAGVRALLAGLAPCDPTAGCGDTTPNSLPELGANVANPFDEVGLVTYPALKNVTDRQKEINCADDHVGVEYPSPYQPANPSQPGYDIVDLSSDYRVSDDATTLNGDSAIVRAMWWLQCAPNDTGTWPGGDYYGLEDTGDEFTYLAGAIAEAQYLLTNAPPRPDGQQTPQNVIIVLSDGVLNKLNGFANGAQDNEPCASAAAAAQAARDQNTLIYSIAYNSSGNCSDTHGAYVGTSGLQLMKDIATPNTATDQYFYNQPDAGDLTNIFSQIAQALGIKSRLIS